jgi:hypothetical protein
MHCAQTKSKSDMQVIIILIIMIKNFDIFLLPSLCGIFKKMLINHNMMGLGVVFRTWFAGSVLLYSLDTLYSKKANIFIEVQ